MAGYDIPSIVTAAGTLGAVAVAIVSAVSAERSAQASARQVQHAEKVERQRTERELAVVANRVIALSLAIKDTGDQVLVADRGLAVSSGGLGGSRQRMFADSVERLQKSALDMQGDALSLLNRRDTWNNNTEDELTTHLTKLEGHAIQLDRVRRRLERELDSAEALNAQHREQALSRSTSS